MLPHPIVEPGDGNHLFPRILPMAAGILLLVGGWQINKYGMISIETRTNSKKSVGGALSFVRGA